MSKLKIVLAIPLIAVLLFVTGCDDISKNDLSGTWKESSKGDVHIPTGSDGGNAFEFKKDGTYQFLGLGSDEGEYEIKDDKIIMKPRKASMGRQDDYTIKIQDKGKRLKFEGKTFEKEKD